jgi:hypothetical protein
LPVLTLAAISKISSVVGSILGKLLSNSIFDVWVCNC